MSAGQATMVWRGCRTFPFSILQVRAVLYWMCLLYFSSMSMMSLDFSSCLALQRAGSAAWPGCHYKWARMRFNWGESR